MKHSLAGYEAVRQPGGVAVWNRSPRGLLEVRGSDRVSFLQGMVSNDVAALTPGESCHAALLDSTGHILADLRVHAFTASLIIETDPERLSTLSETLDKFLIMEDVAMTDVSAQWAIFSLLGEGVGRMTDLPGEVRRLAFTLAPGFDLWVPVANAPALQAALLGAGAVTLNEDAIEALRVEAGVPAWGRELTSSVLLPEAGMEDAVSYTKGCYIGQEIVARLHARGHANRALCWILLASDAPIPPPGAGVHVPEDGPEPGREIGRITSAVTAPRFGGCALALAYVRREYWEEGTAVSVQIEQPGGLLFSYGGIVKEIPSRLPN